MMTLQCVWLSLHGYVHLIISKNSHLMISEEEFFEDQREAIEEDVAFGFINDGFEESTFVDSAVTYGRSMNTEIDLSCGNINEP